MTKMFRTRNKCCDCISGCTIDRDGQLRLHWLLCDFLRGGRGLGFEPFEALVAEIARKISELVELTGELRIVMCMNKGALSRIT